MSSNGHILEWTGLYKGQYDLWSEESYAHPAICGIMRMWKENIKRISPLVQSAVSQLAQELRYVPFVTLAIEVKKQGNLWNVFVSIVRTHLRYLHGEWHKREGNSALENVPINISQLLLGRIPFDGEVERQEVVGV